MASDLTVIIPTIDRPTLQQAIDSVLTQTVACELIVEHDPRRTGCGPTLNRALVNVHTLWQAGVGDDDALLPTFAECLAAQDQTAAMVIFQMRFPDGKVLPTLTTVDDLECGTVGSSFAVRADVAREIGYMDVPCAGSGKAEDWEMIQAVRDRGLPIVLVPQVQVLVRPHDG